MEVQGLQCISEFLQSDRSDYFHGLALLQQSDFKNARLLMLMSKGPNSYNNDKLLTELRKVLFQHNYHGSKQTKTQKQKDASLRKRATKSDTINAHISKPSQNSSKKVHVHVRSKHSTGDSKSIDSDIRLILDQVASDLTVLYKKRGYHHHELRLAPDDQQRYQKVKQIVAIQEEIEQHLKWRDHINEFGKIPGDLKAKLRSGEDEKRLSNVKNYIRRYKSKIPKASSLEEKQRYQAKLDEYQKELDLLT